MHELKPVSKKPLSNIQKMQKIIQVIEEDVRPRLTQDGGDIELVDVVDNKVIVSLRGACSSCRASTVTLKDVVEATLKEHVDENLVVVQA